MRNLNTRLRYGSMAARHRISKQYTLNEVVLGSLVGTLALLACLSNFLHMEVGMDNLFEASPKAKVLTAFKSIGVPSDLNQEGDQVPLQVSRFVLEATASNFGSSRVLVAFPTIPVSFKGSDSRPLQAIEVLTELGFIVDLMFWRDYATEIHDDYDDTGDRQKVHAAGVQNIIGPFETVPLSETDTFVSWYGMVVSWAWPHVEWLDALSDFVSHIKSKNGATKVVIAVDDAGLAARFLEGGLLDNKRTSEEVKKYTLSLRQDFFLGDDYSTNLKETHRSLFSFSDFHPDKHAYATILLHQEMFLYTLSDMVLGINKETVEVLKAMVPATPAYTLRYISPIQPDLVGDKLRNTPTFHERQDMIFFGYDNFANRDGLEWFMREVLPHVDQPTKLHIVGKVHVEVCECQYAQKPPCNSRDDRIVCHGALESEDDLNNLVSKMRVAINPVLESSGVATKTCRAMALGTPTVVMDRDGTFNDDRTSLGGRRCKKGPEDVVCFFPAINELVRDEHKWLEASEAAALFIEEHFGYNQYKEDWRITIQRLDSQKTKVAVLGDAVKHGESLASQNWHLVEMLNSIPTLDVSVISANFEPPIDGVNHGTVRRDSVSPLMTGYQADVVIQQSWPPQMEPLPFSFCGHGCRIAKILPWEFGSLPEDWMQALNNHVDFMWGPSTYNRRVFERSGFPLERTEVAPAGIDCEELLSYTRTSSKKTGVISFLFTGGYLPRKGVDVLFQEWNNTFCDDSKVALTVHTSYHLGYTAAETKGFLSLIEKCKNIEWIRDQWLDRARHLELFQEADIYISPYRSEGFGLSIVESLQMGKSVVVSVGESASKDYVMTEGKVHPNAYPVTVNETVCDHHPCQQHSLCVFDNQCRRLVHSPKWFEVDRASLREQMKKAVNEIGAKQASRVKKGVPGFCWSNMKAIYMKLIANVHKAPIFRKGPHLQRPKQGDELSSQVVVSCLIENGGDVSLRSLEFFTHLQCSHDVSVHVIVREGKNNLLNLQRLAVNELYPFTSTNCANRLVVHEQPPDSEMENLLRVDRIQRLREFQREKLAAYLTGKPLEEYVIIFADLDMLRLPPVPKVVDYAVKMIQTKSIDVLCSNGMDKDQGYYDWFATILFPDTFIYPIEHRPQSWGGEDREFIMGENGNCNSQKLWNWFREQGVFDPKEGTARPVPVRSCFGGLAYYRAHRLLDFRCKYGERTEEDNKYANNEDQRPCEHVVLHNCLRRMDPNTVIALQPDLTPLWHKGVEKVCRAEGNIWRLRRGDPSIDTCEREAIGDIM